MNVLKTASSATIGEVAKIRRNFRWRKQLKEIQQKTKSTIRPLSYEQLQEIKEYYARFGFRSVKTDWHEYIYSVTGDYSPKMIPEDFFHSILERIYNLRGFTAWEDKAFMPFILDQVKFPETICCCINGYFYDDKRNMITKREACALIQNNHQRAIAKPTLASGGGKGIMLVDCTNPEKVMSEYKGCSFIVQRMITQSIETAALNPSSVNTEKVLSFMFKGQVYILSAHMRVGAPDSFTDNAGGGKGWILGINDDGTTADYGLDIYGNIREKDYYGNPIKGKVLPQHKLICEIIKKSHKFFPYFGFMSWDFCVNDKNEPVLIEYNTGQPMALAYQLTTGTLFGELTDAVLSDASKKLDRLRFNLW